MTFTTRFAPSPTGPLHLGHAYSALLAHDLARSENGHFLLRIEDIDASRSRDAWRTQILDDLTWLGITWDASPVSQITRLLQYRACLQTLWDRGLLFACTCTRRDILEAANAPQEEAQMGPDGVIYPGTCRRQKSDLLGADLPDAALRLDIAKAGECVTFPIHFKDACKTPDFKEITLQQAVDELGDIVLARRDMGTSYHLSVVLDDAFQNITHVVRGEDLFEATSIHVLLQNLLGLPTPNYHHHPLIRDEHGKRLAKRDDARALSKFRAEGASPQDIRRMVGLA